MENNRKSAMMFIVLMGLISLFADITYESARSLAGPYLNILGASAVVVGFAAGAGELFGYGLRFFSGLLSDKTKRYWAITIIGYVINLFAIPALALANQWPLAVALMVTERIGKAIRNPARDAMLSSATSQVGRGWGFAIHEAMDQIGAMTGPIIVMIVLAVTKNSYKSAYAVLAIPAALAIAILILSRMIFPHPHKLETDTKTSDDGKLPKIFWLYMAAVGLIAAGFADYPLVAYHIKQRAIFQDKWIPLLYAIAMGIDGVAALVFGRMYDKKGMLALAAAVVLSAFFAIFAFGSTATMIVIGICLWAIGMGAQESIIRAVVADMVPKSKRGTGYGLFNAGYGICWFLGSTIIGLLYEFSIPLLMAFSVIAQLASLPLLISVKRKFIRL
ncbi:MAG: MFS transporter [Phycisphaerales bacterium]